MSNHREDFLNIFNDIQENRLFTEKEYYVAKKILHSLVVRNKNYIFSTDFKSKKSIQTAEKIVKSIKTIDENLNSLSSTEITELLDHLETLQMISTRFKEISSDAKKRK